MLVTPDLERAEVQKPGLRGRVQRQPQQSRGYRPLSQLRRWQAAIDLEGWERQRLVGYRLRQPLAGRAEDARECVADVRMAARQWGAGVRERELAVRRFAVHTDRRRREGRLPEQCAELPAPHWRDRKSTRLNSSHITISY